ncbi:MAG: hypothetical protein AAGC44_02120 [Planctomycetota bacterium]
MKKPVLGILILFLSGFIGGTLACLMVLVPMVVSLGLPGFYLNPAAQYVLTGACVAGVLIGKGLGVWMLIRLPQDARARLNPRACTACGYDLFGTHSASCPECGTTVRTRQLQCLRQIRARDVNQHL